MTQSRLALSVPFRANTISQIEHGKGSDENRHFLRLEIVKKELEMRRHDQYEAKIQRQRDRWKTMPTGKAKTAFLDHIEDRIWQYWEDHEFGKGDVLLEWLPAADAQKLLDEYFTDEEP